jgi:hypothetical protein
MSILNREVGTASRSKGIVVLIVLVASSLAFAIGRDMGYRQGIDVGIDVGYRLHGAEDYAETVAASKAAAKAVVAPDPVHVERNVGYFIVKDLRTQAVIARVVPSHPTWVELTEYPDGRNTLRWLDGILGQSMELSPDWYVSYFYEPTIVDLH